MTLRSRYQRFVDRSHMGSWYTDAERKQQEAASASAENRLDWNRLVFGSYSHDEVKIAIANVQWQTLRASLLNAPLAEKFAALERFVDAPGDTPPIELRRICVTNYVHALARGGLIPPTEERSA
jgi:hypothetical protein